MARRQKKLLLMGLILAAITLVGLLVSWNGFFALRAKPYSIPSTNMAPTIQTGDQILARQVFSDWGEMYHPERGDIVVFTPARDPNITIVKRLVGLPGDTVQMIDGKVHLNGAPLVYEKISDHVVQSDKGRTLSLPRFRETLPDGKTYEILDLKPDGIRDNTPKYEVPDSHLFVLGDNRDNSVDSRFAEKLGFVPVENVTGVAQGVFYSGPQDRYLWRSVVAAPSSDQ